jgi:2-oxoisovalerate dehydrogenase E1 component alpha subunit
MIRSPNGEKSVAVCFFGDGCASTTDFHSACNFAATLKTPVIFICRNNGYASKSSLRKMISYVSSVLLKHQFFLKVSTPISEQYASDGIVVKGPAYGMASIRVDGNDIFAVHAATAAARTYAVDRLAPVLIEAMTYRLGHHSTSDDSSRYRSQQEVNLAKHYDPLTRLHAFLKSYDFVTDQDLSNITDEERISVIKAMDRAERRPPPNIDTMFSDVYHEKPINLQLQERMLHDHLFTQKS